MTVDIYFEFKVSVTQWTESDLAVLAASVDFIILSEKAKANQASNTFAIRAGMGNRVAAFRAKSCANSFLRRHRAHAVRMR